MKIGVVKEIKNHEYRVALRPSGAEQLIADGHEVMVETLAGKGTSLGDDLYEGVGCSIGASAAEVWASCDMIMKVKEPLASEWPHMRAGQTVFTYFHLAADRELTDGILATGAHCFAYETLEGWLLARARESDPNAQLGPMTRLTAGAGAGIFAMSATYPLDMVRGRLTTQVDGKYKQYTSMSHAARVIIKEEGARALYKGWLPSVIGVVPYVGLNFAVYGTLKDVVAEYQGLKSGKELSVPLGLACGGVAGAIGQTVAYPFDVCRRKLQVAGWAGAKALAEGEAKHLADIRYTGMVDCFVKTVRHEGVGALFHGLSANYIKVAPSIAIAFVCYEEVKKLLGVELYISS